MAPPPTIRALTWVFIGLRLLEWRWTLFISPASPRRVQPTQDCAKPTPGAILTAPRRLRASYCPEYSRRRHPAPAMRTAPGNPGDTACRPNENGAGFARAVAFLQGSSPRQFGTTSPVGCGVVAVSAGRIG